MKTVSLELAKQLKEKGYPQDSQFNYCGGHLWYFDDPDGEGAFEECKSDDLLGEDEYCHLAELTCEYLIASPTAGEILDLLPDIINTEPNDLTGPGKTFLTIQKLGYYEVGYTLNNGDMVFDSVEDKSLADATAKMWLYLKEQGLI